LICSTMGSETGTTIPGGFKPRRENMMDEVAMNTTDSVFEGVDVYKSEGSNRDSDNRIERLRRTLVKRNHAIDEGSEAVCPGGDMVRQGHARVAAVLTDESSLVAIAQMH
jgi:hypothetical protein